MAWPDWRFQTPMSTLDPKAKQERSRWLASGYLNTNVLQSEDAITTQIVRASGLVRCVAQELCILMLQASDMYISQERLKYWLDQYAQSGDPMDVDKYLTYCAFDIVGEAMFSKPFGFNEKGDDIDGSIATMVALNQLVAWGAWYRPLFNIFLKTPLMTWLDVLRKPDSMQWSRVRVDTSH